MLYLISGYTLLEPTHDGWLTDQDCKLKVLSKIRICFSSRTLGSKRHFSLWEKHHAHCSAYSGSQDKFVKPVAALKGVLGSNVTLKEDYYADDNEDLLKSYAGELAKDNSVEVIIAAGGPQPAVEARDATWEVEKQKDPRDRKPIVFTTVANPEESGLVEKIGSPGYNLTGMWGKTSELDLTRMEVLNALVPNDATKKERWLGVLTRKGRPRGDEQFRHLKERATVLGIKLNEQKAKDVDEIEKAFLHHFKGNVVAVVVTADSLFNNRRDKVVQYAEAANLPAIYQWREFVDEQQGLISYGPSIIEAYRKAGEYVLKILSGTKPADLPCSMPERFELVIHPITAERLGIKVPPSLLGRPVEMILPLPR